jgi:pyruvate, water dikinase
VPAADAGGMTTDTHAPWTSPVTHSETQEDARRADEAGRQATWIAWFGDGSRDDAGKVGDTGANLGEFTRDGLPGGPGFVVTADAYLRALDRVGGRGELRARVAGADVNDPAALAHAAKECQALVRSTGMPEAVRRAVLDAYARLGRDVPVVVRVSATADDTAPTSFASMNETFTTVRGGLELVDRIVECWASRWSPGVVADRASHAIAAEPAMDVVVRPMVDARMPGITFTAEPVRILDLVGAGEVPSRR